MKLNLAIILLIIALIGSVIVHGYFGYSKQVSPVYTPICGYLIPEFPGSFCKRHDINGATFYETEGKGQVYKIYVGKVRK